MYTVIWCAQISPPPDPYPGRPTTPARGYGYQDWRYSGEPPPPITHTPFQEFEAIMLDL